MFFQEGWVPLSEVTAEVYRQLQALQAEGNPGAQKGLKTTLALSIWDICDASTKIGVTGTDGNIVSASKDLVAWSDPRELTNEHVHLQAGTVGSSTLADDGGKPPSPDEMRLRYGPFMSLPIVIPQNNFQSSMTFLKEEVENQAKSNQQVAEAARTILAAVEAGQPITRELMRAKLGSALSRRNFKIAWGLAAQHRPELAAPNRWVGI